jgi:phage/plasmid-like protein (TIGR03299 family)
MAHEIESALFVGQPAWHGLGTVVQEAPAMSDAIVMAGLDWTVRKEQLQLADGRKVDQYATIRSSDNSILGTVGPQWTPLQNADAFEWFQPLIEDGSVKLEAAGSLREGQRVWVLAKAGVADVQKNDPVEQYILLSNGHDGKLAVRVGFTTVRVVCANTLKMAHENAASQLVRVQHWSNVKETVADLRALMDLSTNSFAGTVEQMRALDNGMKIAVVQVDSQPFGVDTPQDLETARRLLKDV